MRSLSTFVLVVVCGALVCLSSPAFATVLLQDDFEGETRLGLKLQETSPPVGGGSYVAGIATGQLVIRDAATAPTLGTAGNLGQFLCPNGASTDGFGVLSAAAQTASAGQVVTYSTDVYVPTNTTTVNFAGIASYGSASGWTQNLFDMYACTDGTVIYYNEGDVTKHTTTAKFTTNAWVPVQVVVDFSLGTYTADVGGVIISDTLNSSATSVCRVYLSSCDTGIAFDNLSISTVPEPSTLLLVATGMLGLLAYAWRKQK